MPNNEFNRELKKGLPEPIYLLWSKENFFLEEALNNVIKVFFASEQKDFNYNIFYPDANPQDILDAALTLPFLAPRRLIILKDFHQFSEGHMEVLNRYFKEPSDTTCMVLLSSKEPKLKNLKLQIYPLNIRESDMPGWIKQIAAQNGIKLSDDAVKYLMEFVGTDVGLLASEVRKLTFLGIKDIEKKDIIDSIGMTKEYTPFNLVDALIAGEKTKAFRILKALAEGRTSDMVSILGALNWHYKEFYTLWENKGKRPLKMKESTYRTLLRYLPYFKEEYFHQIFQYLHEADIEMKSSSRPQITLEVLLIKLLQAGARS